MTGSSIVSSNFAWSHTFFVGIKVGKVSSLRKSWRNIKKSWIKTLKIWHRKVHLEKKGYWFLRRRLSKKMMIWRVSSIILFIVTHIMVTIHDNRSFLCVTFCLNAIPFCNTQNGALLSRYVWSVCYRQLFTNFSSKLTIVRELREQLLHEHESRRTKIIFHKLETNKRKISSVKNYHVREPCLAVLQPLIPLVHRVLLFCVGVSGFPRPRDAAHAHNKSNVWAGAPGGGPDHNHQWTVSFVGFRPNSKLTTTNFVWINLTLSS